VFLLQKISTFFRSLRVSTYNISGSTCPW